MRVGEVVVGQTSGTRGRIYKVEGTTSSGTIYVVEDGTTANYQVGENLLIGGVVHAVVTNVITIYTQTVVNSGANNPSNGQFVDEQGGAYVRFAEGSQQMDPLGRTKISSETMLAEYHYITDLQANQYTDVIVGGGTLTRNANTTTAQLSTGTASGDLIQRTTHRYHKYFLTAGSALTIVVACNDGAKANNVRRWGAYDDTGGVFFELAESGLRLKLRTSTSGSLVEAVIPLEFVNGDPVNGEGVSGFNLDPTKLNSYWFDMNWGARGRVGVLNGNGERIVIHEFSSVNVFPYTQIQNPSLPLRYENINTGATPSISVLNHLYSAVSFDGSADVMFTANYGGGLREELVIGSTMLPVLGLRASALQGGVTNRSHVIPINFDVLVEGGNALVQVVQSPTITGASWSTSLGVVDIDNAATVTSGGRIMWSTVLTPGSHIIDLKEVYDITSSSLRTNADGTNPATVFLVARKLASSAETKITATANWSHL